MARATLSDLSPEFIEANAEKLGLKPPTTLVERKEGEKPSKTDAKLEKDLQTVCEQWLRQRGYFKRTPSDITEELPPRGWQIHLYNAKKNPTILDLVILANDGRYTEFELKLPKVPYSSREQRLLCTVHKYPTFRHFHEVEKHILSWEASIQSEAQEH